MIDMIAPNGCFGSRSLYNPHLLFYQPAKARRLGEKFLTSHKIRNLIDMLGSHL